MGIYNACLTGLKRYFKCLFRHGSQKECAMRVTTFTDFGLRALMKLAAAPDESVTIDAVAGEFRLSRNHLAKVIQELSRAGFVTTQRGAGGGFRLAGAPEDITVGEVVRLLEQSQALVECFEADGGHCVLTPACRLKGHLARAQEAFFAELDKVTLAQCAYVPA